MSSIINSEPLAMEDCYFQIRKQFQAMEAVEKEDRLTGDWIMKQTQLISDTVEQFDRYKKPLYLTNFCKNLSSEFKISIKQFHQAEKDLERERKAEVEIDSKPAKIGDSKTAIAEKWIADNYELFYNVVSHRFIGRRLEEPELKEIKLENLYRDFDLNHIKYSWSDLKIILRTDAVKTMNPFEKYFEKLVWDGEDHIRKLASYIKVANIHPSIDDSIRFENQLKKMLVRSIACALEVDFNKHCFTLVHEQQNSGKSTFLRWLCPPELIEYYSENTGLTKDDRIGLAENFIINIDELDAMAKYDINALKSLVSKDSFKERLPYAERTELLKRRCNFVASTNRKEFLADETGSVRWICFHINKINWNYKTDVNINDVWAQAYDLFKNTNYNYQLTPEDILENEKANRQFFVRTAEMEMLIKLYTPASAEEIERKKKNKAERWDEIQFMSATEIKEDIITKSVLKDHFSNVNLGKALNFLGYEQKSERVEGGEAVKGYWLKETPDNQKWNKPNSLF